VALPGAGGRYALAPLLVAVLLVLPAGTVKAAENGGTILAERDTEYQYARVVEYPDGHRTLELNEGQAVHSLYRPGTVLTGNYWDGFLVAPFAARAAPPRRVAILGFAGGTTATAYARYFPDTRIDGVEIDGELLDLAREYFGLRDRPELELHSEDARPFLRRSEHRYDAIFADAYRQPYIPFYLATREFFELASEHLAPGGVLVLNVGHPEGSERLEGVLSETLAAVFPHVVRDPVADTNTLVTASHAELSADRLLAAAPRLPADLQPIARASAERTAPRLRAEDVWTDDHAPVEWLIDKSLLDYAGDAG
jgi:spermidine synthase